MDTHSMDRLTKAQRHKSMAHNRSKGTKPERLMGRLLWAAGVRYRKNDGSVFGHPDFTIRRLRLAIFCDGDFWHGRNWAEHKADHKSNCAFWYRKIEGNIARDREVNARLMAEGWKVFRFWETEIKQQPDKCLNTILRYMNEQNTTSDKIALNKMCGSERVTLQIFGPHAFRTDGTRMPFSEQMAVVSHYLHNRHSASSRNSMAGFRTISSPLDLTITTSRSIRL